MQPQGREALHHALAALLSSQEAMQRAIDNIGVQLGEHSKLHQKLESDIRVQNEAINSTLHAMQQRQAVHEVRPFHEGSQVLIDGLQTNITRLDNARTISQSVEEAVLAYKDSTRENRRWLIGLAVTATISTLTIIAWVAVQIIAPIVASLKVL